MRKLTVKIDDRLVERVGEVIRKLGVTKKIIYKMAILHGIKMVNNGYVPIYRPERKTTLTTIEIELTDEIYNELHEEKTCLSEYVKYNTDIPPIAVSEIEEKIYKEKITLGQLVERMIEAEIKLLEETIRKREFNEENSKIFNSLMIPSAYIDEVKDIAEMSGLYEEEVYSYIIIRGISEEIQLTNFDLLGTDAELLYLIDILGLDKIKTMTLLNYMIKSNRLTWKR